MRPGLAPSPPPGVPGSAAARGLSGRRHSVPTLCDHRRSEWIKAPTCGGLVGLSGSRQVGGNTTWRVPAAPKPFPGGRNKTNICTCRAAYGPTRKAAALNQWCRRKAPAHQAGDRTTTGPGIADYPHGAPWPGLSFPGCSRALRRGWEIAWRAVRPVRRGARDSRPAGIRGRDHRRRTRAGSPSGGAQDPAREGLDPGHFDHFAAATTGDGLVIVGDRRALDVYGPISGRTPRCQSLSTVRVGWIRFRYGCVRPTVRINSLVRPGYLEAVTICRTFNLLPNERFLTHEGGVTYCQRSLAKGD